MTRLTMEQARESIRALATYLGRPLTTVQIDMVSEALVGLDVDDFAEAMRAWMHAHGPSMPFPSASEIKQAVRDIATARWQRHKDRDRTPLSSATREARLGVAKDTMTVITRLLTGKITLPAYLDELHALDAKYPALRTRCPLPCTCKIHGFGEAAAMLERDLAKRAEQTTGEREA